FLAFVALGLLATLFVACGGASSSPSTGTYTVHTTAISFAQSSITLPKGSTLTVVDDSSSPHILANGSWMNGNPQNMHEQGMPSMMANMQVMGNSSQPIGPFNTPGTYHFYCTIHPGMNLTVVVQ
ncbi:MAG TPA: plastocyanin/azurin family copper-binding protein, partial [Ktedonobacteraceae bacterium]|nr:plastocyanin/azurin family copper-binding protein [Ktedonobacteraceae bacterium]